MTTWGQLTQEQNESHAWVWLSPNAASPQAANNQGRRFNSNQFVIVRQGVQSGHEVPALNKCGSIQRREPWFDLHSGQIHDNLPTSCLHSGSADNAKRIHRPPPETFTSSRRLLAYLVSVASWPANLLDAKGFFPSRRRSAARFAARSSSLRRRRLTLGTGLYRCHDRSTKIKHCSSSFQVE